MRDSSLNKSILSLISVLNSDGHIPGKATTLQKIDWPATVTAITNRGLAGYFSFLFSQSRINSEIPATVVDTLRRASHRIAAHNVFYEAQCAKIVKELTASGVENIVLKGFSYMQELFGDTSSRSLSDIDVLIRPDNRMKALEYLLAEGYEIYIIPSFKGSRDDFTILSDITGETHFMKKSGALSVNIDLHWKMRAEFPMNNYLYLDKLPWWENTAAFMIGGVPAKRLSLEMQFIHLALHFASHHHYTGLRWFVELFLFLKTFGEKLDWKFIYQTASSNDCRKLLGVCLRLVNDYLGDSCPASAIWPRFLPGRALLPGEYRFYKNCLVRDEKSRLAEYICMPLSPASVTGRLKMIYYFLFDEQGVVFWEGSGRKVPKMLYPFYVLYIVPRQLLRRRN
ncbi:MAG: nucleotidyltransferase family protein [Syntrophaceae bacterium]|nr:nucleotidyltransferase family protein [Syntrophaceae bacterium]